MSAIAKDFMSDVARGVTTRFLDQQTVPQARWEPYENIIGSRALAYDPANPAGKILVGALNDRLIGIDDNRHVMTVAGSRTGKSVTLVSNLLFYRGSVLALDPKGVRQDEVHVIRWQAFHDLDAVTLEYAVLIIFFRH